MIKILKAYSSDIAILFIAIFCIVSAGFMGTYNGRLSMCKEEGKIYSHPDCLTCEESGREMVNGECVYIEPQPDYSNVNFKNIKIVGEE